MEVQIKDSKQKNTLILIVIIIGVMLVSIFLRQPKTNSENYNNADASFHVLLTIEAYRQNPVSTHFFVPLVTLDGIEKDGVQWGGTVLGNDGNYFYTSFSSAGFFMPYLFFEIFNLPTTENSLYLWSSFLYVISFILVCRLFLKKFSSRIGVDFTIILVAALYLFQIETMHSLGIVYWHHSLFQIVLLIQLNLYDELNKGYKWGAFFFLTVLAPYIEWTGFVSNFAFIVHFFFKNSNIREKRFDKKNIGVSIIISVCTVLSVLIFIGHFLLTVEFKVLIDALMSRFVSRGTTASEPFTDLIIGYFHSFFGAIIAIVVLAVPTLILRKSRIRFFAIVKQNLIFVFLLAFPIVENIIMKQHAIVYSFDRLKAVFILMFIVIAMVDGLMEYGNKIKIVSVCTVIAISSISFTNYLTTNNYRFEADYLEENIRLAEQIEGSEYFSDSILVQNVQTRGYTNLLFNRNVYELMNFTSGVQNAKDQGVRYTITLSVTDKMNSVYQYNGYSVYDTIENKFVESNLDEIEGSTTAMELNDADVTNGISNDLSTVFFQFSVEMLYIISESEFVVVDNVKIPIQDYDFSEYSIKIYLEDDENVIKCAYPNPISFE